MAGGAVAALAALTAIGLGLLSSQSALLAVAGKAAERAPLAAPPPPPPQLGAGGRLSKLAANNATRTIYFGGFFPWLTDSDARGARQQQQAPADGPQHQQLGRLILPAVRMALDHINRNESLLGAYKLEIVPRDTQCNATVSLKEFFDIIYEEPKKMLLYGDACRVSTDPIAKASYFFDLIQVSYADTDPIYTIENYPNFFRVVPSENELSSARIPFIRHFNWTRVGTIYQNLPRYSLPHSKLLTDLERFSIVTKQSVSLPGSVDGLQSRDLGDELRKLKEKDVRIILGNFDEAWALRLFCLAYREGIFGRKYQWILTGVSDDKLWAHYARAGSACSKQELLTAMDGYIITDITPVTRSQRRTISGMMPHEYSDEYRRRARSMNITVVENKFYGYAYDGVWAIADSLHRVDNQLKYYQRVAAQRGVKLNKEIESLNSLLDFDYHKPIWAKLIRNALNKTKFNGVTGTVSFYKNERPGLISFSQFQAFRDMSEVVIGSYDALSEKLDLNVGFPIYWRGSSPPIDYTIQKLTPFRINRTIFVIISVLALLGIVLAIVFLTINIKFRNQRYIKMSSPYLNNLIIIGCILTYTSVIILGLDSGLTSEYNFPIICRARAWVLMAGFTLAFGSMFSKTFRVHSIFTNIKLHKKVIKDYKLFMVVLILLTFDISILVVWHYVDPFYRETNNGTSIQDPDNEDIIIIPELEHCQSERMTVFLGVIYVYKGLLMAFGCFLAWETRRVSIPALNDSKYIGLSVYNVVIMCVIGASLSFVLRDQQDASFMIISIFIIFCSTTTLCLVFVPKVRMLIELNQNPRADQRVRATLKTFKKDYYREETSCANISTSHGEHGHHSRLACGRPAGRALGAWQPAASLKQLAEDNAKKRAALKEKVYEIEALKVKLRKTQSLAQAAAAAGASSSTAPPLRGIADAIINKSDVLQPARGQLAPQLMAAAAIASAAATSTTADTTMTMLLDECSSSCCVQTASCLPPAAADCYNTSGSTNGKTTITTTTTTTTAGRGSLGPCDAQFSPSSASERGAARKPKHATDLNSNHNEHRADYYHDSGCWHAARPHIVSNAAARDYSYNRSLGATKACKLLVHNKRQAAACGRAAYAERASLGASNASVVASAAKGIAREQVTAAMPRSLSMIEYLGQRGELPPTAHRHDAAACFGKTSKSGKQAAVHRRSRRLAKMDGPSSSNGSSSVDSASVSSAANGDTENAPTGLDLAASGGELSSTCSTCCSYALSHSLLSASSQLSNASSYMTDYSTRASGASSLTTPLSNGGEGAAVRGSCAKCHVQLSAASSTACLGAKHRRRGKRTSLRGTSSSASPASASDAQLQSSASALNQPAKAAPSVAPAEASTMCVSTGKEKQSAIITCDFEENL